MYEEYYNNLFAALCTEDINNAIKFCENAINVHSRHSLAYLALILFLIKSNDFSRAQKVYQEYEKINPNFKFNISPEVEMPLAIFILKHFVSLKTPFINESCEQFLNSKKPDESDFMRVVIQYILANDISNAYRTVNDALEKYPQSISLKYNKSAILMKSERLEEAWEFYEMREKIYKHHKLLLPGVPKYDLMKENIKLLVFAVAGFGDTIFYARYLKLLQHKNIDLYIHVQPALKEIFMLNGFNVIDNLNEIKFDYQISFMSLGWLFKTSLDNIPYPDKYICCKPVEPKMSLQSNLKKIAIVWKSGAQSNRRIKIEQLAPIFDLKGFQFYSLQKEINEKEEQFLITNNIVDLSKKLTSFTETANFIEQMDYVIGCDTAVTNLSAALGRETLVMVPFFCDYRWSITEFLTPWYEKARIFRQNLPDNWDNPIANLTEYLKSLAENG